MVSSAGEAPFVVATLGTDHHTFGRLVTWLDGWLAEHDDVPALVQYGSSPAPVRADGAAMMSRDELLERMRQATIVVTHGGTGSVMDARTCGRMPVVVPRVAARAEHVDDHQVTFCRKLAESGWAHIAETEESLRYHLDRALRDGTGYRTPARTSTIEHTARRIDDVLAGVLRQRPGFVRLPRLGQLARYALTRRSRSGGPTGGGTA